MIMIFSIDFIRLPLFFILLFELLPDTTSTISGDCDFLRSCVNYKYREKKKLHTKSNTFFLKCFIQFTCTNLDGSQKEGVTF